MNYSKEDVQKLTSLVWIMWNYSFQYERALLVGNLFFDVFHFTCISAFETS